MWRVNEGRLWKHRNICYWIQVIIHAFGSWMKTSTGTHKPQSFFVFFFPIETNSFQEPHCVTGNVIGSPHPFSCRHITLVLFLNFLKVLNFDYMLLWTVIGRTNRPKPKLKTRCCQNHRVSKGVAKM